MHNQEELEEIQIKVVEDVQPTVVSDPAYVASDEPFPNLGDQYEVLELIGSGGMSLVFKVRDTCSDKLLVAKVLRGGLLSDEVAKQRFQQESTLVQQLTHSNVIEVIGASITDSGLPFLLMEWLDGITLADYIKTNGAVPVNEAIPLFEQMAEALSYAHGKGIIHRDIKPSNVLLVRGENGLTVKIMDFGIAKILESEGVDTTHTQAGSVLGSPAYMSPEQCLGESIDSRSDIYSLGCVMYETLTEQNPFIASTSVATILRHLETSPESVLSEGFVQGKVPDYLEQVIYRCLAKKADLRYQTAADVRSALRPPPGAMRRLLSIAWDACIFYLFAAVVLYDSVLPTQWTLSISMNYTGLLPVEWRDVLHLSYALRVQTLCLSYVIYRVVPECLFRATPGMLITGLRLSCIYGPVGVFLSSVARALIVCAVVVVLSVLPSLDQWSEAIDNATGSNVGALVNAANWAWVLFVFYLLYIWLFVLSKREQWFVNTLFGSSVVRKTAAKSEPTIAQLPVRGIAQALLGAVALTVVCVVPQYRQQILTNAWTNPSVTKDLRVCAVKRVGKGEIFKKKDLGVCPVLRTGKKYSDLYLTNIDQVVGRKNLIETDGYIGSNSFEGGLVESTAYLVDSGIEAELDGDEVLSEEFYRKALKLSPLDRDGLSGLARILEKRGMKADAAEVRKKILTAKAPSHTEIANLLNRDRQFEEALVVATKAARENPKDLMALKEVVKAMKELGVKRAIEPFLRRILELDPANVDALVFLAERTLERKQPGECRTLVQRALIADGKDSAAWNSLARLLGELGDSEGAAKAESKYEELTRIENEESLARLESGRSNNAKAP